ncbi:MAG: LysM peptidoglycan-binding domain-containing protein [bacterium]
MMKRIISSLVIFQLVFGPFAFAKITPTEKTKKIIIKPGDTLWALAKTYLQDPLKWEEFEKYNKFTNPHLIYPGEELAIGYEEAKALFDVLKEKREAIKMTIAEKDTYIDKIIKEIKTPLSSETAELIVVMKEKIEELEEVLNKIRDENSLIKKAMDEKEEELLKAIKERDELIKKGESLNASINELEALIGEKEKELAAKNLEITKLKLENKRLTKEKNQIKTFSYFLTAGSLIGFILIKISSE